MKEEKMSCKSSQLTTSSSSNQNASAPVTAVVGLSQMEGAINQLLQRFDQQERERLEAVHRQNVELHQRNSDFLRSVTQIIFQAVATGSSTAPVAAAIELPGSGGGRSSLPLPPPSTSQAASSRAQLINLCANQSRADEPFQETTSARGAIKILNLNCTEVKCNWRGMADELAAHLRQVHRILEHRCLVYSCKKSFKESRLLTEHMLLDHPSDLLHCMTCRRPYRGRNQLKSHYQRCHQLGYYQCGVRSCTEVFTTASAAYSHRSRCPFRHHYPLGLQRPNTRSASSTTTTTMPPNHSTASAFTAVAGSGGGGLATLAGTSRNSGTTAKPPSLVTSSTSRLG